MEPRRTPWTANILYSRVERGRGVVADVADADDAPLIAAAPDLLAACETFVAHYPGGVNPFLDEAYRQARKAIAKARGETTN